MMKLSLLVLLTAVGIAAFSTGCSGNDGEIAVDAASSPLTSEANDPLFTIRVVDADSDGYALTGLVVKVTPKDKETVSVLCRPNDTNTNGKLEKDESLACAEGPANKLDATIAGSEVKVELFAKVDGEEERIGEATWTPK